MLTESAVPQNDPVQPQPWRKKFEVLHDSPSRCVLRVRGGKRLIAIRVLEPAGHTVRVFSAHYDGGTAIDDWEPLLIHQGTFDEALVELAKKMGD